jgi:hypothetical protein
MKTTKDSLKRLTCLTCEFIYRKYLHDENTLCCHIGKDDLIVHLQVDLKQIKKSHLRLRRSNIEMMIT